MYGLIGSFQAKEGQRATLAGILTASVGDIPGCVSYVVAEDPNDDVTLWITEVWTDAAAHKASLEIPAVKAAIAQGMPLIARFGMHQETRPVGGTGL